MSDTSTSVQNKNSTLKNTLRCVLVLAVIAVVCVAILAVANRFMQPEARLDAQTSALINQIAPTGESDADAYNNGSIKLVDLSKGGYKVTDLDAYNKSYGSTTKKVRALYTSTHKDTKKVTLVVEAEGKGYVDAVVMLIAYDQDGKVSALTTKSQSESFWDHIKDTKKLYDAFIGTSGTVTANQIASSTGVTVKYTLGGMTDAVSIANDFVARLGGAEEKPEAVTDAAEKAMLAKVSAATSFIRYPMEEGKTAYVGDNNDLVIKASGNGGSYGQVTLYVLIKDGAVVKVACGENSFDPIDGHDSTNLRNDATLTAIFADATVTSLTGQSGALPGYSGATQSSNGVREAVLGALRYAATFDASAWED